MKLSAFVVSIFLLSYTLAHADRFYVSASASEGGDGASWETAFRYLQDALDQTVADRGDEVWIAAGTYYPDDGANVTEGDREASFTFAEDVTLYGGFSGNETSVSERDWITNVTTLSGEIFEGPEFWSLHVCTVFWLDLPSNVLNFDGLTITRGNANGTGLNSHSAALLTSESGNTEIKVRNCVFSEHRAESAAVSVGGRWDVAHSIFKNNTGGVASDGNWLVEDCTFTENTSEEGGVAFKGSWSVNNSTFARNSASWRGGVASQSKWGVRNSTFTENFTFGERLES